MAKTLGDLVGEQKDPRHKITEKDLAILNPVFNEMGIEDESVKMYLCINSFKENYTLLKNILLTPFEFDFFVKIAKRDEKRFNSYFVDCGYNNELEQLLPQSHIKNSNLYIRDLEQRSDEFNDFLENNTLRYRKVFATSSVEEPIMKGLSNKECVVSKLYQLVKDLEKHEVTVPEEDYVILEKLQSRLGFDMFNLKIEIEKPLYERFVYPISRFLNRVHDTIRNMFGPYTP